MRVVGFDPGYGLTGWGVVESHHPGIKALDYGCIRTSPGDPIQSRLTEIYDGVIEIIDAGKPQYAVVERLYFSKNRTTAGSVYEARGAILAAIGSRSVELIELTPTQIKQSVTGSGRAGKSDVISMVQRLLSIQEKITPDDTADALAGAIAGIFVAEGGLMKIKGGSI